MPKREETPATFTWRTSDEPTIITASLAESAGIETPDDAPRVELRIGRRRRLTARQVKIPYVRFGKYLVRDVPAYVLPPEGEDLGSQIGQFALKGYRVSAEPGRLRLVIEPTN